MLLINTRMVTYNQTTHCCLSCWSVTQSYLTLCGSMGCSMPGFPFLHHLLELAQTHVHRVVMLSNHLILGHPFLLPSIFPNIRVFSKESVLRIWWPKYWSFSFSISPSNEYSGLSSFRIDWLDFLAVQGTLKSLLQHHSYSLELSFLHSPTLTSIHDHWKNHSVD